MDRNDNVEHPVHYQFDGFESAEVIAEVLDVSGCTPTQAWLYGNAMKYLMRWPRKNGVEDLRKCAKEIEWLISEIEKREVAHVDRITEEGNSEVR